MNHKIKSNMINLQSIKRSFSSISQFNLAIGPIFAFCVAAYAILIREGDLERLVEPIIFGTFFLLYVISELLFIRLPQGKYLSFGSPIVFTSIFLNSLAFNLLLIAAGYLVVKIYASYRSRSESQYEDYFEQELYKNFWAILTINLLMGLADLNIADFDDPLVSYTFLGAIGIAYYFVYSNIDYIYKIKSGFRFIYDYVTFIKSVYLLYVLYLSLSSLMIILFKDFGIWSVLLLYFPLLMGRFSFVLFFNIKRSYIDIAKAFSKVINTDSDIFSTRPDAKVELVIKTAKSLGVRGKDLESLHYAAYLHDIGKVGIDQESFDSYLDEKLEGDLHSRTGADILRNIDYFEDASNIVAYHHMPYSKLVTTQAEYYRVPVSVLKVVTDYLELKQKWQNMSDQDVLDEMLMGSGTMYDPVVIKVFQKQIN